MSFTNTPEAMQSTRERVIAMRVIDAFHKEEADKPKRPDFWITVDGGIFEVSDRAGIFTRDRAFGDYWRAETYVLGCLAWHSGDIVNGAKMLALTDYDRWQERPESWMPGHKRRSAYL